MPWIQKILNYFNRHAVFIETVTIKASQTRKQENKCTTKYGGSLDPFLLMNENELWPTVKFNYIILG